MIVGRGIIAMSMRGITTNSTIFASGVSDSTCTDPREFLREKELILSQDKERKFVYFSTCSLSDDSPRNHYHLHKFEMEKLVSENFQEWLILRLPTVVGAGGNPSNFFNHISNRLILGESVQAKESVIRHLLDADDVRTLVTRVIEVCSGEVVDVCVDNPQGVVEIIGMMKNFLLSDSVILLEEGSKNKRVDNTRLKSIIGETFEHVNRADYNRELIKKYLRK